MRWSCEEAAARLADLRDHDVLALQPESMSPSASAPPMKPPPRIANRAIADLLLSRDRAKARGRLF